ncbi:MAG: Phospholipid methyltransferase [Candidatus Parcubacteria bacterium]
MILPSLVFISFFVMRALANSRWGAAGKAQNLGQFLRKELLLILFVVTTLLQWFGIGAYVTLPDEVELLWQVSTGAVAFLGVLTCYMARAARGKTWTRFGTKPPERALTTHGMYCYSRHPYYLGIMLFVWGVSLCFANLPMLVIALVWHIGAIKAARTEEVYCEREFGSAWRTYKEKTPFLVGFFPRIL